MPRPSRRLLLVSPCPLSWGPRITNRLPRQPRRINARNMLASGTFTGLRSFWYNLRPARNAGLLVYRGCKDSLAVKKSSSSSSSHRFSTFLFLGLVPTFLSCPYFSLHPSTAADRSLFSTVTSTAYSEFVHTCTRDVVLR